MEVGRYEYSTHSRRARILAWHGIDLVLDIGANAGRYATELRTAGYSGRIVSFEPLLEPFTELAARAASDRNWECHRLAFGDSEGAAEMHVAENFESSSFLPMAPPHLETMPEAVYRRTETVPVKPLDAVIDDLIRPHETPLLKLDVQGYEMHVLRGAVACLSRMRAIEAELSLASLYDGQPSLRDMLDHLAEAEFQVVALDPHFFDPPSGYTLQVDGIFVRVNGAGTARDDFHGVG